MKLEDIHERLLEYERLWPEPGKDDLSLLKTVLFIEDVFGLNISDEEITKTNFGTHQAIKKFVIEKLETSN